MQEWQHAYLRSRGYKWVFFNTFNRFKSMMLFGLDTGFLPVGVERRPEGDLSIKFTKDLTTDAPTPGAERNDAPDLPRTRTYINHTNTPLLRTALLQNFDIAGILHHDRADPRKTQIILDPA